MSASALLKRQSSPFDSSVVAAPAAPALAATDATTPASTARPSRNALPAKAGSAKAAPTKAATSKTATAKARRAPLTTTPAPAPSPASNPSALPADPLSLDEDGPLMLDAPSDAWFLNIEPFDPTEDAPLFADRPRTRRDCADLPRPCPWITCRYHLWAEVAFVPRRKLYRWRNDAPAPWEMRQTCSLDVAEEGGSTLEEVGTILGLTRERVRQLEAQALAKLTRFFKPEDRENLLESIFR